MDDNYFDLDAFHSRGFSFARRTFFHFRRGIFIRTAHGHKIFEVRARPETTAAALLIN